MNPSRNFARKLSLLASLLMGASPAATLAGDIDTHLTSTYFLARQAGYDHREAHLIAKGNWSLDLNGTTTALPLKNGFADIQRDINDPGAVSDWQSRGRRFHLLGSNVQESHANLVQLNRDFQASTAKGDTRLIQLGQYLHAAQDAHFHQTGGEPYGPGLGHLLSGDHGHAADKVNKNFATAVKANQATYEILKHFKDNGALPAAPEASRIYNASILTSDDVKQIVASEKQSRVVQLTSAVAKSYGADGELNREQLQRNVAKVWGGGNTQSNPFIPPAHLDSSSKFKIDYDGKDAGTLLKDTSPTKVVMIPAGRGVVVPVTVRDPGGPLTPTPAGAPAPGATPGRQPAPPTPGTPTPGSTISTPTTPAPTAPGLTTPRVPGPAAPGLTTPRVPAPTHAGLSVPTSSTFWGPKPGGISLSMAAAARLALNIKLDGIHASNGRLVLTGQAGNERTADAALFLTALRAACEPGDPFMSLDADNGKAWSEEGARAGAEIWSRIKGDFGFDKPLTANSPEGLVVRTVSVRRDYPKLWAALEPSYPNLKARLVFRPDWLRETRFGEIMYVADVLLKELSAGIPTLQAGPEVRAAGIERYRSSDLRSVVRGLTESVGALPSTAAQIRSFRLWFDLAPDGRDPNAPAALTPAVSMLDDTSRQANDPASVRLRQLMQSRGHIGAEPGDARLTRTLAVSEAAVDLSQVWPQMFVRGHDHATRRDILGTDQALLALSEDVNRRTPAYAAAYKELRELAEVFRLYVAAVGVVSRDRRACQSVQATPLLRSERASRALPSHHPTELAFTVASYTHGGRDGKRSWHYQTSSFNGGVHPRGRELFEKEAVLPTETAVTRELKTEAAAHSTEMAWAGKAGRQFVALQLDDDPEFLRAARLLAAFKPTTREMVLAQHPELAALDREPAARSMLDDPATPTAAASTAEPRGMLDDVDQLPGKTVIVPRR